MCLVRNVGKSVIRTLHTLGGVPQPALLLDGYRLARSKYLEHCSASKLSKASRGIRKMKDPHAGEICCTYEECRRYQEECNFVAQVFCSARLPGFHIQIHTLDKSLISGKDGSSTGE